MNSAYRIETEVMNWKYQTYLFIYFTFLIHISPQLNTETKAQTAVIQCKKRENVLLVIFH